MTTSLCWDPSWTVHDHDHDHGAGRLRLSAGADRVVDVDGLTERDIAAVVELADGRGSAARRSAALSSELRVHLVDLGAVRLEQLNSDHAARTAVIGLADAAASTVTATSLVLERAGWITDDDAAIDDDAVIHVVVRCGPGQTAPHPARPRLVVDIGNHHSLVVGPFVVPGCTACEGCLDARMARRFEPAAQPAEPGVARHAELVAELVGRHVELALAGRSPVLNATVVFDLDTMTARRDPLLMSPGCAVCDVPAPSPRPILPWEEA